MKKLIATIALSLSVSAAHAVGPEVVIGALIGGILIGQSTTEYVPVPQPYPHGYYPAHPPVGYTYGHYHYAPRPMRQCFAVPLYDAYGRYISTTRRCHYVQY